MVQFTIITILTVQFSDINYLCKATLILPRSPKLSHHPKQNLYPLSGNSSFSPPPPPFLVSVNLLVLDISCKYSHPICVLLWLANYTWYEFFQGSLMCLIGLLNVPLLNAFTHTSVFWNEDNRVDMHNQRRDLLFTFLILKEAHYFSSLPFFECHQFDRYEWVTIGRFLILWLLSIFWFCSRS